MDRHVDGVAQRTQDGVYLLPSALGRGRVVRAPLSRGAVSTIDLKLRDDLHSAPSMRSAAAQTVIVSLEGHLEFDAAGRTSRIVPGCMHCVDGLVDHHRTVAGLRARRIVFHLDRPLCPVESGSLDARSLGLALALVECDDGPAGLTREALALRLLERLVRAPSPERELAERAQSILRATLAAPPSHTALAATLGVSPRTLSRAVRRRFDTSVFDLLISERIDRAKFLLRTRTTPIGALGLELGFSSASHFSSVFRERVGLTPSAFRADAGR
ncbi:MAG: helix-turn-helix transcriptional regulator [Myxococcota bacterium]